MATLGNSFCPPQHICRIQNPDIQRAGRVGAHGGAAGRGRAEQFAQETSLPRTPKASKTSLLNVFPEARTSKIPFKPMAEQNLRLTTGLSAVHPRFITGTRSALGSWLLANGPTPICLCKPFSCKACPGNTLFFYVQGYLK